MISFLSSFRKFEGGLPEIIQRSAIYTWSNIPIIAASYDNIGTPVNPRRESDLGLNGDSVIVPDLIKAAVAVSTTPMLALLNSDILITPSFLRVFDDVIKHHGEDIFLTGSRFDIHLDFQVESPETYTKMLGLHRIPYNPESSADIFIASIDTWRRMANAMPPYIHGRCAWDNWIHSWADRNVLKHFNCTNALEILHCNHPRLKTDGHPSVAYNYHLFEQSNMPPAHIDKWPSI